MRLFVITGLAIAFLAIFFAVQNTNLVTVQFFVWEYRQRLAVVLLSTLAIGVIIGLLVSFPAIIRRGQKASRNKKQADTLTELIQEKEQAVSAEAHRVEVVKQSYGNLLRTLGLIEPVSGLLREDFRHEAIANQIRALQSADATEQSLSLLLFKVQPGTADGYRPEDVFAGVAQQLQKHASTNTQFYSNGKGLFTATTVGLDMKAANRYSEDLQATILENLPTMPTGEAVEADVSVGGAIADHKTTIDANQLLSTAETALEQALQRGRNRLRILQAS